MSADAATADFFRARLDRVIDLRQPLVVLASRMPWQQIEASCAHLFSRKAHTGLAMPDLDLFGEAALPAARQSNAGRPRILRTMIALLYLKHAFDLSDEAVVERWSDSPNIQYFSGMAYFEASPALRRHHLIKFRRLLGEEGVEELLSQTITTSRLTQPHSCSSPGHCGGGLHCAGRRQWHTPRTQTPGDSSLQIGSGRAETLALSSNKPSPRRPTASFQSGTLRARQTVQAHAPRDQTPEHGGGAFGAKIERKASALQASRASSGRRAGQSKAHCRAIKSRKNTTGRAKLCWHAQGRVVPRARTGPPTSSV
ncbi:MAG: transposase [Simplicispira sp.]|nr:transposase [Simplicispira sp.]